MPEAPDLQVVLEVLRRRVVGRRVTGARVLRPTVLRSLATEDMPADVAGRTIEDVWRRGKFLVLRLSGERLLVVHPMLTGGLELCPASQRVLKRTCLAWGLAGPPPTPVEHQGQRGSGQAPPREQRAEELRYFDDTQMGQVYYLHGNQLQQVPRYTEQGPDVLDEPLPYEEFAARLRRFPGELKGTLTRGAFVAGIGNAYADEVLFAAGVHPFRKRRTLSEAELRRLHEATYRVPREALAVLRERVGEAIHLKVRDFLQVHGKGGGPCPRCGGPITTIAANQRLTNYCRRCQPGLLVRN